jgi:hypothetical protein
MFRNCTSLSSFDSLFADKNNIQPKTIEKIWWGSINCSLIFEV